MERMWELEQNVKRKTRRAGGGSERGSGEAREEPVANDRAPLGTALGLAADRS